MSNSIAYHDHKQWGALELQEFNEYANKIRCHSVSYAETESGEWFYASPKKSKDGCFVIYGGYYDYWSAPGAFNNTYAELFDTEEEYNERIKELEAMPEEE